MVKCYDCGFCEPIRRLNRNGLTEIRDGLCRENTAKSKRIEDVFTNRKCRKFKEKNNYMTIKDWQEWKHKNVTLKRHTCLTLVAIVLSALALAQPHLISWFTPEIVLEFPTFPEGLSGVENKPINSSVLIYNKGTTTCFIQEIRIIYPKDDGSWDFGELVTSEVIILEPKQIEEVPFQLSAEPANTTKSFEMIVFYDNDEYTFTPVGFASWWWALGNFPIPP